jgi:hypothetical protein
MPRGHYAWVPALRGYIAFLRDRPPSGARARLQAARAQLLEHELRRRRGEVVEVAVAEAAIARLKVGMRAKLAAVPARYGAVAYPDDPSLGRGGGGLARLVRELLAELDGFWLRGGEAVPIEELAAEDAAAQAPWLKPPVTTTSPR